MKHKMITQVCTKRRNISTSIIPNQVEVVRIKRKCIKVYIPTKPREAINKFHKIRFIPQKMLRKLQAQHDVYMTSLGCHSRSTGSSTASSAHSASMVAGSISDTKQKSIRHDGLAGE